MSDPRPANPWSGPISPNAATISASAPTQGLPNSDTSSNSSGANTLRGLAYGDAFPDFGNAPVFGYEWSDDRAHMPYPPRMPSLPASQVGVRPSAPSYGYAFGNFPQQSPAGSYSQSLNPFHNVSHSPSPPDSYPGLHPFHPYDYSPHPVHGQINRPSEVQNVPSLNGGHYYSGGPPQHYYPRYHSMGEHIHVTHPPSLVSRPNGMTPNLPRRVSAETPGLANDQSRPAMSSRAAQLTERRARRANLQAWSQTDAGSPGGMTASASARRNDEIVSLRGGNSHYRRAHVRPRIDTTVAPSPPETDGSDEEQILTRRPRPPHERAFGYVGVQGNAVTPGQMLKLREQLKPLLFGEIPEGITPMCDICQKDYSDSKVEPTEEVEIAIQLPCKHVFGEHCINTWFDTCKSQKNKITCPMCRKVLAGGMGGSEGSALAALIDRLQRTPTQSGGMRELAPEDFEESYALLRAVEFGPAEFAAFHRSRVSAANVANSTAGVPLERHNTRDRSLSRLDRQRQRTHTGVLEQQEPASGHDTSS